MNPLQKILVLLSLALAPFFTHAQMAVSTTTITQANVFNAVNAVRASYKLPALVENAQLDAAAAAQLKDLETEQYFAHISPAGLTPWDWIRNSGYSYQTAGENLAEGFSSTDGLLYQPCIASSTADACGWMNSPKHEANIVHPLFGQYTQTGVATDGNLVVQIFGTPEK